MRQTSRFDVSAAVRLIGAICLLVFLWAALLLRPTIRARYLSRELETLQLGRSTFEDAQRLAKKIGAKPNGPCDRLNCEWDVRVDNAELPRLWRGSGEGFVVAFDIKNSVVVRKNTGYGIGVEADGFYPSMVSLEEQEHWGGVPTREPVQAGWYTTEKYRYYWFQIKMTPKASAEERRRYTSYDFNCFWRYKGCRDGRELLPAASSYPVPDLG